MIAIDSWKKITFVTPLSIVLAMVGTLTLNQAASQGATAEAIVECMKKLMYGPGGRVCYMNGMQTDPIHCQYGAGVYAEWRNVIQRSDISEDAAAKACRNASGGGGASRRHHETSSRNTNTFDWQHHMRMEQNRQRYMQEEQERYKQNSGSRTTNAF